MGRSIRFPFFFFCAASVFVFLHTLYGTTNWTVTDPSDPNVGVPASNTLRGALLRAGNGDTILFQIASPITLTNPLPTITQDNLTIQGPATISGANASQIFSIAPLPTNTGFVTLSNLTLQNGLSQGGNGGSGGLAGGGGGGAGGGGALYLHVSADVIINNVSFLSNQAVGGNGGNNNPWLVNFDGVNGTGGGGGGFGGGDGQDGFFIYAATNYSSGGGGGGNCLGGTGGNYNVAATNGGLQNIEQSGGGGGGGGNFSGGASQQGGSAYIPQLASSSFTGGNPGGVARPGGGGAGAGGIGGDGTNNMGGAGGIGIGMQLDASTPASFGGGGGGGAGGIATSSQIGGAGSGTGGGGGGPPGSINTHFTGRGGNGGVLGGGGGGGGGSTQSTSSTTGGNGGIGGGGGAGVSTAGQSSFGGGIGTVGAVSLGGGGGGAAMGGAIFIQNQGQLTIGEGTSLSNGGFPNVITAGTGPAGGAGNGQAYGQDLFVSTGGTVTFTPSSSLTIAHAIQGNEGQGTSSAFLQTGGLIMNGTGTLDLSGNTHTYSPTTTILQGTVQIDANTNLGSLSPAFTGTVIIQNGTLQMKAAVSSARPFSLTGNAAVDIQTFATSLTGQISGGGSLTVLGSNTLSLSPSSANTYTGGTTINGATVSISAIGATDSALGNSSGTVTMLNAATLITNGAANMSSSRNFTLQGPGVMTIQTDVGLGNTLTMSGAIGGSGGLLKTGTGDLWLKGTNSYTGNTTVSSNTLFGNTSSLQGVIQIDPGTKLVFLQPSNGIFAGTLSGSGTLQMGDGSSSYALVQMPGISMGFNGLANILSGASLQVNGSLAASSLVTIFQGGSLSGTGTVGPVLSGGTLRPGNSIGTITIENSLDLTLGSPSPSMSNVIIELSPTSTSLVQVLGPATLAGNLTIMPNPGFYGFGTTYTILTSTGLGGSVFDTHQSTDPNFLPRVSYTLTDVLLNLIDLAPFTGFPYDNPNEESVGNNINALTSSGSLTLSSPLAIALESLVGLSNTQINEALDQLHPAPFSAFAEIQADLGAQLLSFFHRRPGPHCECLEGPRFWIEPYGHWLRESNIWYQVGFHARAQGAAAGVDLELLDGWSIGIGGVLNESNMQWRRGQGFSTIRGYYAAIYSDYFYKNFYVGVSCARGFDQCHSSRHIYFSTLDEHAHGSRNNTEWMGQITLALSSGPSNCFTFPYFTLDYFYLEQDSIKEKGASGLNLHVSEQSGSTLRTEAGFLLEGQTANSSKQFCLSPLFGVGWAMETPIHRTKYRALFEGQTIPFRVTGWEYTWQLLTVRLGLTLAYRCLSLYGGYVAEVSPLAHTPFVGQRGDIRLQYSW